MPSRHPEHAARASEPSSSSRRPGAARKELLGADALTGMLQASLTELASELSQGKSERLLRYLDFAARFHHYSRANQWLILSQMPHATRVASYRTWQEEGYQVARGETGIRILAPSIRTFHNDETGEDEQQVVGFVAVSVFDVSQLTPEKRPPEFFTPIEGNAAAHDVLYVRLVAAATADGFVVEQTPSTQGAEGFSHGRRLVTRTGLASTNRVLTFLHEYAHGLLHQGVTELSEQRELTRALKECHAEATAYVVACHAGLPTPYSADYLLQWGTTPEMLRDELDSVIKAASHIIIRLNTQSAEEKPLHEDAPGV